MLCVLGASSGELAMVAMILILVVLAPKVPRIGERIGAWFGHRGQPEPPAADEAGDADD